MASNLRPAMAADNGISAETIAETLRMAVAGVAVDIVHAPTEKEDLTILLRLPRIPPTPPLLLT